MHITIASITIADAMVNNVCGIKLKTKAMCSHEIRVEEISLFLLNRYICMLSMTFEYYMVCFKLNQFDMFTDV